jgi:hypothetical protein
VGKDKNYFWKIADTFRDPRVWTIQKGKWIKQNVDGSISEYGKVHLTNEQIDFFNKRKN